MKKYFFYGSFLWCVLLAPIQSAIWNGPDAPTWIRLLATKMSPISLPRLKVDSMEVPPAIYFTYGRGFIFVYIGLMIALVGADLSMPRWLKRSMIAILGIGSLASFYIYWISALIPEYRHQVFLYIEVPALLLLLVGIMVGFIQSGEKIGPLSLKSLTIGVFPLAFIFTLCVQYLPHGPMLAIFVSLIPFWHPKLRTQNV